MASWTTKDIPDHSGKLAIITGATGGLGLETALGLAGVGAEVLSESICIWVGRAATPCSRMLGLSRLSAATTARFVHPAKQ